MGLIKAAMGAAGGVMADQWKEYFYCEALPVDVLAVRGRKKMIAIYYMYKPNTHWILAKK